MKRIGILTIALFIIALVGCGGPNEATKVGNPTTNLPKPPKQVTEEYTSDNPFWQTSTTGEDGLVDTNYLVEFDIENSRAYIYPESAEVVEVVIEIREEDGAIITVDDNDSGIEITGTPTDSETFPFDVRMNGAVTLVSAIDSADGFGESEAACEASEIKCKDNDGNVHEHGQNYVASSVVTTLEGGPDCGVIVADHCISNGEFAKEGDILAEGVCGDKNFVYVECNCVDARCVDLPSDEAPEETEVDEEWDEDAVWLLLSKKWLHHFGPPENDSYLGDEFFEQYNEQWRDHWFDNRGEEDPEGDSEDDLGEDSGVGSEGAAGPEAGSEGEYPDVGSDEAPEIHSS